MMESHLSEKDKKKLRKDVSEINKKKLKELGDSEEDKMFKNSIKKVEKIPSDENLEKFKDKDLLEKIKDEISKDHLGDDELKMTIFLTMISSLLSNPKRRMSLFITSGTSEGKDNVFKSTSRHIPKNAFIFLTSGTQATMEDDLKEIPLVILSEINLFKEGGANKHLLEVIKQRTEGGTSAIKKDLSNQNKTAKHEEGEQGSVIYGTTDIKQDSELGTRLMKGSIKSTPKKTKKVNDNSLDTFSDTKKIIEDLGKEDSWIRKVLTYYYNNEDKYDIVIPYAKFMKEKINGIEIFDSSDPRSQRDVKRLLSLTCATTWLKQDSRNKIIEGNKKFLESEIGDLIDTLRFSNKFFNQTYAGMDLRVNEALKFIDSKEKDVWVDKLEIQEYLGIKHRDTINNYLWNLEEQGFIERSKGVHLNEHFNMKLYKGNHIYYKSVQKVFNKCLINVQLDELKKFLEKKSVQFKRNIREEENINEGISKKENKAHLISYKIDENEHLLMGTYNLDFFKSNIKGVYLNE